MILNVSFADTCQKTTDTQCQVQVAWGPDVCVVGGHLLNAAICTGVQDF
jgi:hypothetical protein